MKWKSITVWGLTIGAFVFLFFSLRTETRQLYYSLIALAFWAVAYFVNKIKVDEN